MVCLLVPVQEKAGMVPVREDATLFCRWLCGFLQQQDVGTRLWGKELQNDSVQDFPCAGGGLSLLCSNTPYVEFLKSQIEESKDYSDRKSVV